MALPPPPDPRIDPDELRSAMARFPTGVTVVTAPTDEGPAGLAANAVTSLSLEPPLILACLDRGSRTLRAVEAAGSFGINVLPGSTEGEGLARGFGRKLPVAEKWRGVSWRESSGLPRIDAAIVFVACRMRDVLAGGDHVIITGEVEAIEQRPGEPLLFVDGDYKTIDAPGGD
jgi:flavin reductase (DIM6/NTAB) family NADH-FMN oxidoreductase RutF